MVFQANICFFGRILFIINPANCKGLAKTSCVLKLCIIVILNFIWMLGSTTYLNWISHMTQQFWHNIYLLSMVQPYIWTGLSMVQPYIWTGLATWLNSFDTTYTACPLKRENFSLWRKTHLYLMLSSLIILCWGFRLPFTNNVLYLKCSWWSIFGYISNSAKNCISPLFESVITKNLNKFPNLTMPSISAAAHELFLC